MTEPDDAPIAIALSRGDWRLIQEALDEAIYEADHREPAGWTKTGRARDAERLQSLSSRLRALDERIGEATGQGQV